MLVSHVAMDLMMSAYKHSHFFLV